MDVSIHELVGEVYERTPTPRSETQPAAPPQLPEMDRLRLREQLQHIDRRERRLSAD